jgi:hypothetical protein
MKSILSSSLFRFQESLQIVDGDHTCFLSRLCLVMAMGWGEVVLHRVLAVRCVVCLWTLVHVALERLDTLLLGPAGTIDRDLCPFSSKAIYQASSFGGIYSAVGRWLRRYAVVCKTWGTVMIWGGLE